MMKRVFLSFREDDKPQTVEARLVAARSKVDIEFNEESVTAPYHSRTAEQAKRQIRDKISRSSLTVCLLSSFTHTSEWVDWEIDESIRQGKAVICMGLPNAMFPVLPPSAEAGGLRCYSWDPDLLGSLIESA